MHSVDCAMGCHDYLISQGVLSPRELNRRRSLIPRVAVAMASLIIIPARSAVSSTPASVVN
jgi:hypothetical protein